VKRVCVFCASSPGVRPAYIEAARAFGETLARRSIDLVYGGGNVGLMGAVADGALAAGGSVVGVIPRMLVEREVAHLALTELVVVETMHERKAEMAARADAFIALPGGLGTLEELFEVWTWGQLGVHTKPLGMLDVEHYYAPLIAFLDHATREGLVRPADRSMAIVDTRSEALLDRLARHIAPQHPRYVDPTRT